VGSRWRRLPPGRQALLVLAHLRKGETYTALASGFGVGTTTVFRYVREGVDVLAAVAPTLDQALDVARRKAFVILDGTLLSIDRVGMASGYDRAFFSGKHKRHGLDDPAEDPQLPRPGDCPGQGRDGTDLNRLRSSWKGSMSSTGVV
jgi:DDE superfamily endonuclease